MSATKPWHMFGAFGAGLALGLAMLAGYMLGNQPKEVIPAATLNDLHVKAMSGFGSENFAMITGPVDPDSEGVFTLDYLTGELRCQVINPRNGKFGAGFSRNVVADLGVEKGKKPAFVMATGMCGFKGTVGPTSLSTCVVYVADANTGRFGAYVVPWTRGAFVQGAVQFNELKLLVTGEGRSVEVRGDE